MATGFPPQGLTDPRTALKASAAALIAGQVLFPDINGLIIQDSNLFWDNTNKRLGIGTTNPGSSLEATDSISIPYSSGYRFNNDNNWRYSAELSPSGAQLVTSQALVCIAGQVNDNQGWLWRGHTGTSDMELTGASAILYVRGKIGIGASSPNDTLDVNGNIVPHTNKGFGLGTTSFRWGASFIASNTTGTSRLVNSGVICKVCNITMVRSTGETIYLGEDSDYSLAWCPNCGDIHMEQITYPDDFDRTVPLPDTTEFIGIRISAGSGNTYRVYVDFKYTYQGKEYFNSTIMSRDEKNKFITATNDERLTMLKEWANIEWKATMLAQKMEEYVKNLQLKIGVNSPQKLN